MNVLKLIEAHGLTLHGDIEHFAALVEAAARADEREAIAQMFEDAPALVKFAQNENGGCLICGFTPKMAMATIRARGTT